MTVTQTVENLEVIEADETGLGGEEIVGRTDAAAATEVAAGAEATAVDATKETPAAKETPAVEKEAPVEELAFEEGKTIVLDQKKFDSIMSGRLKKEKDRIEKLEQQLEELQGNQHSLLLDKLAIGGVKRSLLEKTGLKGAELEAYAAELAEIVGTGNSTISLEAATSAVPATGIGAIKQPAPRTVEDALESIGLSIDHPGRG